MGAKIERKFKVGDTVKLKSGGPIMTVRHVFPEQDDPKNPYAEGYGGYVECSWFKDTQHLFAEFHQDMLDAL